MTVISRVAPLPTTDNPLITSEEEHLRLIAKQVSAKSILIFDVAHLVAQYAHKTSLTDWHTALSRLGMLPEQIPPLKLTHEQIHEGVCPQLRGSFYLIPSGTLNALEAKVKAYGETHLAAFGEKNPLQFRTFWEPARLKWGDFQYPKYEWRWMSDDILEGSRARSFEKQAQMVAKLGANFEIPSLRDAAACLFLHKVATGESLLQCGNEQNESPSTYTHVQDTAEGLYLAIGGSAPSGVGVSYYYGYDDKFIGVVALRKF
jgi:hypothetical protein